MTRILFYLVWLITLPFTLYHIFRPQHKPCDESNRINKIRLLWLASTRQYLFTDVIFKVDTFYQKIRLYYKVATREQDFVYSFEWLKYDELKNITRKKSLYG